MNNPVEIKELLLHKTEFVLQQSFSPRELAQMKWYAHENRLGEIILHLKRSFYSEKKITEEVVIFHEYNSWWDHFKDIYFPKWLLKRFPVKKNRIKKRVSLIQILFFQMHI